MKIVNHLKSRAGLLAAWAAVLGAILVAQPAAPLDYEARSNQALDAAVERVGHAPTHSRPAEGATTTAAKVVAFAGALAWCSLAAARKRS